MRATIAIVTMAKTHAHWQQQYHHDKGNNTSLTTSNKGNNTSLRCPKTTTVPLWQEQQLPLGQWQRCLRIDGNNATMTSMTMPAWWWATRATTHACAYMQTIISYVHVCMHPCKYIICLGSQASLQTLQTFAVGKRMTFRPLTPPPPLVLKHLCAEIGVNILCWDKIAPTTVMLVLQ